MLLQGPNYPKPDSLQEAIAQREETPETEYDLKPFTPRQIRRLEFLRWLFVQRSTPLTR